MLYKLNFPKEKGLTYEKLRKNTETGLKKILQKIYQKKKIRVK